MKILKASSQYNWEHKNMLTVLNLNYNCNFKCSYCVNKNYRKAKLYKQFDFDLLKKVLNDLFSLDREKFVFAIAGGEPTLYPYLHDFFKILQENTKKHKIHVSLSTNGSMLDRLIPCIESAPDVQSMFTISLHEEQMAVDKYMQIIENFKYPEKLNLKYLILPENFHNILPLKNLCEKVSCKFVLHTITDKEKRIELYSDEDLETIKKYSESFPYVFSAEIEKDGQIYTRDCSRNDYLLDPLFANYKDFYCMAGYSNLNITPEGKVYRCFRDLTNINFSLYEHSLLEYPLLHKIYTCDSKDCGCPGLLAVPKWRKEIDAPDYITKEMLA